MKLRYGSPTLLLAALALGLLPFRGAAFTPMKATYSGLFYETNGYWQQSSGLFTLTTTARYGYTARVQVGPARYSFSGQLDSTGHASRQIQRRYDIPLTVDFQVDALDPDLVEGSVSTTNWFATLIADRAVFDSRYNTSTDAGQYTMVVPGDFTSTTTPGGAGYGTITVTKTGAVRFAGTLADGTKFTQSTRASKNGDWPLYATLYQGWGSLYGWMRFNGSTNDDLSGDVIWVRPDSSTAWYYPAGFAVETFPWGSRYVRPPAGTRILSFSNGHLEFNGGDLNPGITNFISLDSRNRVTNLSPNKLTLTFSLSNGSFTGRVMHPVTSDWISFKGVILQRYGQGGGYFPGWTQTGEVWLLGD